MKVAIVHYWFTSWRGGERVVQELFSLYPQADIYTHVADRKLIETHMPGARVHETFIARLPFGRRLYRFYLPLMPMALENLDLQEYDLIISSESGPAKGIIKRPDALHICYCHSPMRYIWDLAAEYRRQLGFLKGTLLGWMSPFLRQWDVSSAARVDQFIANSRFVAWRIESYYRRSSVVIHPPVKLGVDSPIALVPAAHPYYVVAGELVGYKRVDIAIEAAKRLGRRLVVVGDGEQGQRLSAMAGDNVEFVGRVSDVEFRRWIAGARALLFPGIEDFGMVPVEAMSLGTPVIAYARGGALEYLVDGVNGITFQTQDSDGLADAIGRFEAMEPGLDRDLIRASVAKFSVARFRDEISSLIEGLLRRREMTAVAKTADQAHERRFLKKTAP